MKAVLLPRHGQIEVLKYKDISEPECKPGKVKINIHASSINHLDIWVRNGIPGINYPLPMVLGSDGAGTIIEVGSDVIGWKVGDEVVIQPGTFCAKCRNCIDGRENYCHQYGILGETENGVQAEYIVVDPINIHAKAKHLNFAEAASMPLVFMTAYEMLIKRAKIQNNDTILIYGGASGIGSAAIQICLDIGANIITTVGSRDKIKHAKNMGANQVVLHSDDNWPVKVKDITGKNGVNVVFEHVGKKTWKESLSLLSRGGRIVTCGATTGQNVRIDLSHLFIKQHSILGSTMSSLNTFREVMVKIHNKKYFAFVDKIFNMQDIGHAHKYIDNRQQKGKVVMIFDI